MRLSVPPRSSPPASADVNQAVAYLRSELDTCTDQTQRALLHYDLALVFEQARDDHSAAKELMSAVNANATLREPLEHLIALIERRRSHVNLGKLLDRLARIAESPEETVRAQLARGDFLTDHRSDFPAAIEAYRQALALDEQHCLTWLALHYVGARQSDATLVEEALNQRIVGADDSAYRDAIRLQLARFQAMRGHHDMARSTLRAAATPGSPLRFPALLQLEQLIVNPADYSERTHILEHQATALSASLSDPKYAALHGVPSSRRRAEVAADAWLRAALNLEAAEPDAPRILTFLDNAQGALGDHFVLTRATLRHLQRRNLDAPRRAVIGKVVSRSDQAEPFLATTWLLVAQDHLREQATDEALEALNRALHHDRESLTARALGLELLWGLGNYADLGKAYEEIAKPLDDDAARARNYLLAGIAWGLSTEGPTVPRSALTLAAAAGASHTTVARLSKLLAALRKDGQWATEALTSQVNSADRSDRVVATLELSRRAALRGDTQEAERHLRALSEMPEAGRLGWALLAYGPATHSAGRTAALHGLAAATLGDAQTDVTFGSTIAAQNAIAAQSAIAVQQVVAGQRVRRSELADARELLESIHDQYPEHAPVAIQLVRLLHQLGSPSAAVHVLNATAAAASEPRLIEAFYIQAGILAWQTQARDLALQAFESASASGGAAASQLLYWAVRGAQPDDPAARRRALEMSLIAAAAEDRNAYALERFALEVGFSSQNNEAAEALNAADELSLEEIGEAVQLARALYPHAAHHQEAIKYLQNHSSVGKELVAATDYYKGRALLTEPIDSLLTLARLWASQGSLEAALEWFSLAVTASDRRSEAAARLAIACHLPDRSQAAMRASVALLSHLSGELTGREEGNYPEVQLVNAELTLPTALPLERARALEDIVQHYEHGPDANNQLTLLTLSAYNWLACGKYEQAESLFRQVVEADPDDLAGWYGLTDCAHALDRPREQADAQERVGTLHLDRKHAAAALREAARINLDILQDQESGYRCLGQSVSLDITDFNAFDRWFRHVRTLGERQLVIDLCTARLDVAESPKELTRLHWERSRASRHLGHLEEALSDLENVRLLDPQHVGARALASEIFISLRNYSRAAAELAQLAAMPHAPAEQRHLSGLAAVDLYETQLDDVDSAIKVLKSMAGAPGDRLLVKERLAKTVARASRWHDAVWLLGELSEERKTAAERAEAARLRLAILRDKLDLPEQSLDAVATLLRHSPADEEALDLVLEGVFDDDDSVAILSDQLPALLDTTARELEPENAARLARMAEQLDQLDLRLLALSSLVCLGSPSEEVLLELQMLQQRCAPYPRMAVGSEAAAALIAPGDSGPLLEIMRLLAPHLPEIIGPTLKSLGVGRRERKRASELPGVRAEVAAWAGAFTLTDIELFVGGSEQARVTAFADAKHGAIALGEQARPPLTPAQRAALAASVLGLKHGTSIALSRDPVELAALLVSACRVGGVSLPSPPFALAGEFERLLSRELPRRVKRALEPLAAQAAAQGQDPLQYAHAARATLDRVAAVAAGDFSWVLLSPAEREQPSRNLDGAALQRQRGLLEFCLSLPYLEIRRQIGMGAQ